MSFRPGAPVVSTRGEISLEVNRGFLSGRFLGYSLCEFGLRRPLEMTYGGNMLKSQQDEIICHFDQVERSGTRGEISFGDAALFPVREISRLFAARIRLTPTARNDIWR